MAIEAQSTGTLKNTDFKSLLLWVEKNRFSGSLVLSGDHAQKSIIFEEGRVIAARSNMKDEGLGAILLKEKRVNAKQLQEALEQLKGKETAAQGEILLSKGVIDPTTLEETLRKLLLMRIHEIFRWEDGKYALVPTIPANVARMKVQESLLEIIFRGLISKYSNSKASQTLSVDVVPKLASTGSAGLASLKLGGKEMAVVRSMNGKTKLSKLLKEGSLDEGSSKALLLALRDLEKVSLETPTETTVALTPAQLMADARNRIKQMEKTDHFTAMGLARSATSAQVKEAYFEMARKFHPDRLPDGLSPEDRKQVEMIFARISSAFGIIGNDENRKEYEATLDLASTGLDVQKAQEILQSELEFQKGQTLIKKGDLKGAVALLEKAISLYDQESEYHAYLGWAYFRQASKDKNMGLIRKGKELMENAVKTNDKLFEIFFYLGMVSKSEGDLNKAIRYFEKTLQLAPKHTEAASELRLINMRKDREDEKGKGLKGLFRKKD